MNSTVSDCTDCGQGTYRSVGMPSCEDCPAGRYSNQSGATNITACLKCPAGTFISVSGATNLGACQECSLGRYQNESGSIQCNTCPPGRFNPTVGSMNFSGCQLCPVGRYQYQSDQSDCLDCPKFSYAPPSSGSVACTCEVGRYTPSGSTKCDFCPLGAVCLNNGTRLSELVPQPGYWRPNDNSTRFYKCDPPSACVAFSIGLCSKGYTGVACGACESDYFRNFENECQACTTTEKMIVFFWYIFVDCYLASLNMLVHPQEC